MCHILVQWNSGSVVVVDKCALVFLFIGVKKGNDDVDKALNRCKLIICSLMGSECILPKRLKRREF